MKNTLTLIAFLILACGPSKEEIAKAHARNEVMAMEGLGCSDTTAYYAAYFELRRALSHPAASDIDSLHEAAITRNGDSVSVSVHGLASNAFGVKDNVSIYADFYCQDGKLYWWDAVGTDGIGSRVRQGEPVERKAREAWRMEREVRLMEDADAWVDSLKRVDSLRKVGQ